MQQSCLIITGMHRSGTSATAGVFTKLGFPTSSNLLATKSENSKGFFEDAELVKINNEILASIGSSWHDITLNSDKLIEKLPRVCSFEKQIINNIRNNYSKYDNFILKDPRFCLLLPLYQQILQNLNIDVKVIITYRDPVAISNSLQKRNGFSLGKGFALWFNYFFAAEKNSRKTQRVFLNYDQLLEETTHSIAIAAKYLGIKQLNQEYQNNKKEVDDFLDQKLRHENIPQSQDSYYLPYYRELEVQKLDLNQLSHESYSQIKERYDKARDLFYYSEVTGMLNNYEELMNIKNTLSEKITEKEQQIDGKECQLEAVYATKSWRITKPLRDLNYLKRKVEVIPQEITDRGGMLRVGNKIIKSIRRNGLQEIFRQAQKALSNSDLNDSDVWPHGINSQIDYTEWINRYDTLTEKDRQTIKKEIEGFECRPLLSVIMPVYEPPINFLDEAIGSVCSQLYPNWELCIADDASKNPAIRKLLEKYTEKDKRIKVVFRTENGHISKASNSALKLASGEYVILLDHDDLLSEHALFWVANEINDNSDVKLIYSDEDKINEKRERYDAYFKSDWNPDLFLSQNMFSHLGIYSAELIKKIGGFRAGFEGSQDYDLALRCLEHVDSDHIKHIPRVLYHWRAIAGSTAKGIGEKDYAKSAGTRAINDFLRRNSIPAMAKSIDAGYRVKYKIPKPFPMVSLIIQTRDMVELLSRCIDSVIAKSHYPNYEIIIIDNGSVDQKTLTYLKTVEKVKQRIKVIRNAHSLNYSNLINRAVVCASGELIGLIGNNTEVINSGWMREMVSHACRPEVGAVGALLLSPDCHIQHAGVVMGLGGMAGHAHKNFFSGTLGFFGRAALQQVFSAVTGTCLFVRKHLYEESGGLNETELGTAFYDIDFCLRLKEKGYRNIWTPYAKLFQSVPSSSHDTSKHQRRFNSETLYMKQRWSNIIRNDPSYNPNLTLKLEDFSLATPPRVSHQSKSLLVAMEPQAVYNDIEIFPWMKPLTAISENKGRRILIIVEVELPQCYTYRVRQKVDMFELLGYEVTVCKWNDKFKARCDLQTHALIIFYRVPGYRGVKLLLAECERLGLETFFDVDDLIFDRNVLAQNRNVTSLPEKEKEELFKGCEHYRYTLEHCRHAIASTPIIAKFMKKYCNGHSYIVENCIDKHMFTVVQNIEKKFIVKDRNYIVIGYGSGTTTHDVDFQQCAPTILKVLTTYPQVRLAVHGHLQLPSGYEGVQSQILRVPFLPVDDYFRALATFDINLAPLENTLFNDAKSNIKYIEASMFAIPTIASPGATFKQIITHGKNGFLCTSPDEWLRALSVLIEDKSQRIEIGENARETVFKQYDYKRVANKKLLPLVNTYLPSAKKKKHILIVNVLFSPIAFGGATIVTEELAQLINQDQEMEVTIFTGFWDDGGGGIPYEEVVRYEALGIPIIAARFPREMTQELDYKNADIAQQFYHVLKSTQPDIVHFHSIQQLGASMAESCLKLNIPYIITLHDTWWLCERQFMVLGDGKYCGQCPVDPRVCINVCTADSAFTYARYYYLRNILMSAAVLLTPSDFQKKFYVSNGFKESHVKVNKNGVLPPSAQFKRKKSVKTRFAYLGGNAEHKGYHWLAKVFESIELTNYSLCLVDCQEKIGVPSIHATDWPIGGKLIISDGFDHTSIDDFFSNIDVLLFPSQCKESFGLTVREALIRDVWVIVTDSGGTVEDVIPGVNGQIFDRNDTDGFRQAVVDAIEKRRDFINPHKEDICLFSEQAQELIDLYTSFH